MIKKKSSSNVSLQASIHTKNNEKDPTAIQLDKYNRSECFRPNADHI